MKVDFHVHSSASDGTVDPADLATFAAAGGFAAIAITDHDNMDGAEAFLAAGRKAVSAGAEGGRTLFVPGVELSIDPGEGFDRFHLLGLGVDGSEPALKALMKAVLDGRNRRNEKIFENFRRIGIGDIAPEPHGEVLARPHFAKWLAQNGYAPNVRVAFEKYLLADSPPETRCYESRWRPSQEDAFAAIHAAGGICVMAHPKYWRLKWKQTGIMPDIDDIRRGLCELKEKGLDAVEAHYNANTHAENRHFSKLASGAGLLRSAGSDFHGANKPAIPIGMHESETFIGPLVERLRQCRGIAMSATEPNP